ncbi:MAG: 2-dehydro-3-deoxyphosphogluconate aldolase [Deltaproteobacteria bacterium]|nr:MAG: 2-dehydro-3-deoxyphosphogluconate aldolase [Deltaproteobacteria bacterium]
MIKELDKVFQHQIIPVIAIQEAELASPLAEALVEGGLPCAEITFRTAAAKSVIKTMADRGDMLVGAGTVLTIAQAQEAVDVGATFIISPGFNPKVVEYCLAKSIPVIPGIATPTEIQQAIEFGLEMVKFFPAEAFGGLNTLKAISAPFNKMKFIPTGGINTDNICDYLNYPKVVAAGGSWMARTSMISNKQFEDIARLTSEAVALVASI